MQRRLPAEPCAADRRSGRDGQRDHPDCQPCSQPVCGAVRDFLGPFSPFVHLFGCVKRILPAKKCPHLVFLPSHELIGPKMSDLCPKLDCSALVFPTLDDANQYRRIRRGNTGVMYYLEGMSKCSGLLGRIGRFWIFGRIGRFWLFGRIGRFWLFGRIGRFWLLAELGDFGFWGIGGGLGLEN